MSLYPAVSVPSSERERAMRANGPSTKSRLVSMSLLVAFVGGVFGAVHEPCAATVAPRLLLLSFR